MKRILLGLGLILASGAVDTAVAQIIQPRMRVRRPIAWTSLSIGWLDQQPVLDPETSAGWNFGQAPQWRATLEYPLGNGASVGALGTTARVPLVYAGTFAPNSCVSCDADANVSQIMGLFHLSGGAGFHQVIDVAAGYTLFSNFRATDGTRLAPLKTVSDFSFGIGYGFGYGFNDRMEVMIVQDYSLILHKRQQGESNNTAQQRNLRIGLRVGLGDK